MSNTTTYRCTYWRWIAERIMVLEYRAEAAGHNSAELIHLLRLRELLAQA